jgi:Lon protease-like protein
MFPLGSVLFPYMPLPLRIFEERYLVMLSRILQDEPSEFGVVLIERGQEVGGGEHRFDVGTVAQITELDAAEEFVVLVAQGERRFEITAWLDDDPYPQALMTELDELEWDDELIPLRDRAEEIVRSTLRLIGDQVELVWPADIELADDPAASAWQLAAIAPLGPLDQIALLRSTSMTQLLSSVIEFTIAAEQTFGTSWPED